MTARTRWTGLFVGACLMALHVDPAAAQPAPAKANPSSMRTMTYPVADLVVPFAQNPKEKVKTNEEALMTLIKTVVAPTTWKGAGGTGRIQYFPASMSLVISADAEIQAEVREMFKALRRLQDLQVCTELRVVETSPEMAETWRRMSGMSGPQGEARNTAVVSPEHMRSLLIDAQECARTNVLCAPQITTINGQRAAIHVGSTYAFVSDLKTKRVGNATEVAPVYSSKDLGMRAEFTPVVASDRKEVRVKFSVELSCLVETKKRSVSLRPASDESGKWDLNGNIEMPVFATQVAEMEKIIPGGKTLLVSMGEKKCVCREDCSVAVLSELPLVGEWFRGTREVEQTKHVFLTLTPRVLVLEEASVEVFEGTVAPIPRR